MSQLDVKIGDLWLGKDFGLIVGDFTVPPPEVDTYYLEIPGTSDVYDLSEQLSGDVEYHQRKALIPLICNDGKDLFYSRHSKLLNYCHGRKMPITTNKDSAFIWNGRVNVDSYEKMFYGGTPTISALVNAFKDEEQSSLLPWKWDNFSFIDGIIRDYFNLSVAGSLNLIIIGRRKRVCPTFYNISGTAMTVTYLGNVYTLNLATPTIITDIFLGEGEHVLTFTGTGMVSVDYRGAML